MSLPDRYCALKKSTLFSKIHSFRLPVTGCADRLGERPLHRDLSSQMVTLVTVVTLAFSINPEASAADRSTRSLVLEKTQQPAKFPLSNVATYATELARIDRDLNARLAFADTRPDSSLHQTRVAETYLERARLSGKFNDYVAAQNALQNAFSMVDRGHGPVLLRAMLNFSLHRLSSIESDLQVARSALLVNKPTIAKIEGIRADVSLQQGHYADARRIYEKLENNYADSTSAVRLAFTSVYSGHYEEAERWFGIAEERVVGQSSQLRSWLNLQLGILDLERGRLNDALDHYRHALSLFPGYWLVEEHIAEVDMLQGRADKAERAYRDLIKRTESPLFMIALADILAQRGQPEKNEAAELLARANRSFEDMARKIPEVIAGHALEHFLLRGNPTQALQMAADNYRLRSGGPSALLLAQAHAANSQLLEASEILDELLSTRYSSANLHATAGVIYGALGASGKAGQQKRLALAINPAAVDDVDWLKQKIGSVKTVQSYPRDK